jgi:hypothetical protein
MVTGHDTVMRGPRQTSSLPFTRSLRQDEGIAFEDLVIETNPMANAKPAPAAPPAMPDKPTVIRDAHLRFDQPFFYGQFDDLMRLVPHA